MDKEQFKDNDTGLYYVAMQNLSMENMVALSYHAEQFGGVKFSHISNKDNSRFTYVWFREVNIPYQGLVARLVTIYNTLERKGGTKDMVINKNRAMVPLNDTKVPEDTGLDKKKEKRKKVEFIKLTTKKTETTYAPFEADSCKTHKKNNVKKKNYYDSYLDKCVRANSNLDMFLGLLAGLTYLGFLILAYLFKIK